MKNYHDVALIILVDNVGKNKRRARFIVCSFESGCKHLDEVEMAV